VRNTPGIMAVLLLISLSIAGRGTGFEREDGSASVLSSATQVTVYTLNSAQVDADQITIKDAWIQEGPPSQKITAGFMVIENHGPAEIALLSASTDVAGVVELHKMELDDGMMRMKRVDSISVPAGGMVELKPGGFHLMVIDLKKELKAGDDVKVTLQFSGAIQKTVTVPVKKRSSVAAEEESR
jgi:copper(I)-binding protein